MGAVPGTSGLRWGDPQTVTSLVVLLLSVGPLRPLISALGYYIIMASVSLCGFRDHNSMGGMATCLPELSAVLGAGSRAMCMFGKLSTAGLAGPRQYQCGSRA